MMKSSMLFECGPFPTSRPPDIIHMIRVPRPSLFLPAFVYYTERKPKNKMKERPGNEAKFLVLAYSAVYELPVP